MVGLAALAPALRKAESRLGREINVTSYSTREFRRKVTSQDRFLSEVLRAPKQFVKGSQNDLDTIAGGARRPASSNIKKGTT
jgi:hypothetical protein